LYNIVDNTKALVAREKVAILSLHADAQRQILHALFLERPESVVSRTSWVTVSLPFGIFANTTK